jgi:hypothetical protein
MYSFLVIPARMTAAIKPESHYDWFTYQAQKPVNLDFRGKPIQVTKGTKFGVRPSSNEKQIRLIFPDQPTKVFTLSLEQARQLAKGVKE